jgi:uncharacterized protein (DUF58 family)
LLRYFGALKFRYSSIEKIRRPNTSRHIFPFSIRITPEGTLYLLFILLLSFAALNSGNNLLFIILAVLLSAIAISGIVSKNSLKQVSLSLQMPENVFVNEKVFIKVSMTNLKRIFPSFSIRVEDPDLSRKHVPLSLLRKLLSRRKNQTSDADADRAIFRKAAYFPILQAGETRSELMVQSFPHRGLYQLQGFWISTQFPFGFFRRGERISAKGEVLVYPLIQEISSFFHLLPFLPGQLEGSHVGPGENLFSIRKYQEAESARIIDWKATAKTGELMAREFARDEESKFCLILDTQMPARADREYEEPFEKAVSLAASIAAHFLEEGAGMEFLTPREYVPRGIGPDYLYRILRSLAVVKYEIEPPDSSSDFWLPGGSPEFKGIPGIQQIPTDKVFKIIITSRPRGSFSSAIWRSSHVIFFDEL